MGATADIRKRLRLPEPETVEAKEARRLAAARKLGLPVAQAAVAETLPEVEPAPAPRPKLAPVPQASPVTPPSSAPAAPPQPSGPGGVKLTEEKAEKVRERRMGERMQKLDSIIPALEAWADLLAPDTPEKTAQKAAAAQAKEDDPVHKHAAEQAEKLALEILGPVAADFIRGQGWYVASGKQYKDGAASVALSPRKEHNPLPDKFFRAMKAAGFDLDPQSHSGHAVWTKEPEPRQRD